MYTEETRGIRVIVEPSYLREESRPQEGLYLFAYKVTLVNTGSEMIQLLSRHWIITDANGQTREVQGEGVIGQQPVLGPGVTYEYSSFSPLPTPMGKMRGSYLMKNLTSGETFKARIPLFFLRDLRDFN
jgi:ApaG protein